MTRLPHVLALALAVAVVAAGGCNKPSEENCRKALANMRSLLGTDSAMGNTDTAGDVRRCVGGSSRKAVDCAINAKTLDELRACEFMGAAKKSAPATAPAAPGSATTAPGSATP